MKKLLFFLCLLYGLSMYAEPIDVTKAKSIAKEFFFKKNLSFDSSPKKGAVKCRYRAQAKGSNLPYYIFNADEGYVIVSGTDCSPNILGYSLDGTFNADSVPESMQAMLDFYEEQIRYMETHNISSASNTSFIREPIAPLLTCKWAQHYPYNLMCPTYNGTHCVTGCLATALSQVMYYYKWPKETTQEIPGYNLKINGISTDVPAVPAGTKFDWDNMLPTYSDVTTNNSSLYAVASLMAAVGTALHMDYNTGSSSASFGYYNEIPKKYFGYNEKQILIFRSDVENWEDIIYNELVAKRPVVYGGQSANGGHAFVVDGYDGDQLFHVDWGYGGAQGYYLLDVMNQYDNSGIYADYSGDGYSKSQCAIINLVPSGWNAESEYTTNDNELLESKGMRVSGSLRSGQAQELLVDLINKGAGFYGSLQLYGGTSPDSKKDYIASKGFTLKRRDTRRTTIPWTPQNAGTYWLYLKVNDRTIDSLNVTISTGNTSSNLTGLQLVSIHMDGEDIESKHIDPTDDQSTLVDVVGHNQTTTIAITNVGTSRWDGNYKFDVCAYNAESNTYTLYQERTGSGWGTPGYTWNYERSFTNLPCGKYRIEIYANDILVDDSWHFNVVDGVPAWSGPKEKQMLKIHNKKIEIYDNILAVDFTGRNDLEIIPNENPNTFYIFDSSQSLPNVLKGRNILLHNNDSYYGESINLQGRYSYYSPYAYTAKSIKYTHKFNYSSTTTNPRWETFCLPFTASKIVANDMEYKWSRGIDDNSGNFWLEKMSQLNNRTVNFVCENEDCVIAWRPYVIAAPKNVKEMIFSAVNIIVSSSPDAMPRTDDYSFTSNLIQKESYDLYSFEGTDNSFRWSPTMVLSPFSSYILPNKDNDRPEVISIKAEIPEVVEPNAPQCALPDIIYDHGCLRFVCDTEDVGFVTEIKDADIGRFYDDRITLTATYEISVYATKAGYKNSDVATATLVWSNASFTETTPATAIAPAAEMEAPAPVLIQNNGGTLTIQGAQDGTSISVFTIVGIQAGTAISQNSRATINTCMQQGDIAIIKIGERSVKIVLK